MPEEAIDMPMHGSRELPRVYFREADLPEIKEWKVGGEYYLIVKVEQTGIHNNRGMETPSESDKVKIEASFQVKAVKALTNKPVSLAQIEKEEFKAITVKALGSHPEGY